MTAALFGGSFDPPHLGHDAIIRAALSELPIDKLYVVPAFLSPFKDSTLCPAEKRLEWMRKLCFSLERTEVLDFEIRQQRPTPTIETVIFIQTQLTPAPDKLFLIIGSDQLEKFHLWERHQELLARCELVVATRDEDATDRTMKQLKVDVPVSSSTLRRHLDPKQIPGIIAQDVQDWMIAHSK